MGGLQGGSQNPMQMMLMMQMMQGGGMASAFDAPKIQNVTRFDR
jgi:hypothetical protein